LGTAGAKTSSGVNPAAGEFDAGDHEAASTSSFSFMSLDDLIAIH
jgi:hypothetical protein